MKLSNKVLLCLGVCGSLCKSGDASQFFTFPNSAATAVDATGHTVVGQTTLNGEKAAFIWQQGTGMLPLEVSNGATLATAITPDGITIVGQGQATNQPPDGEAFITNPTQGFTLIGGADVAYPGRTANGVTSDGTVVVGSTPTASKYQDSFRWTQQDGFQFLGDLPGGTTYSVATGVSSDGGVIAGFAGSYAPVPRNEAFRWTEADGIASLGDLPGGESLSWAYDVSANGKVIVGQGSSAQGQEAFRWDQTAGIVGLGILPSPFQMPSSSATSLTPDGSVIVGWSGFGLDTTAFVWDIAHGMRSLQAVLSTDPQLAGELTGWTLESARAISENGQAIVGTAMNPQGQREAFLVLLDAPLGVPEPSSLVICISLCGVSLGTVRQRRGSR